MQTRIAELPAPAIAGGLVVLGGVALWQLGIEFERAWIRSYDGPLLGDTIAGNGSRAPQRAEHGQAIPGSGANRRWVANHHPRAVPPSGTRGLR
jgi:hypothetical protein